MSLFIYIDDMPTDSFFYAEAEGRAGVIDRFEISK